MNEHFGLIARLAREHRLSSTQEDELTRMAQNGASAPDLAEHALRATERDAKSRPPAHTPAQPASYSAHEAPEVAFPENGTDNGFGWFGNSETPLPPVK